MSTNKRIFYACQGVAIAQMGTFAGSGGADASDGTAKGKYELSNMVHGVQAVGTTTTFNPEQAFELGQVEIYENVEGTPDIELTLSKVIDGYPLIYHMATTGVAGGSLANSGLINRSKQQCDIRLGIFDEGNNNIAGGATAEVEVFCSGMFVSSIGYTFPVDGFAEESVTFVGNNKQWLLGSNTVAPNCVAISGHLAAAFDGEDSPLALGDGFNPSGGVQRREDFLMQKCIFPASVRGVVNSGHVMGTTRFVGIGNGMNLDDAGTFSSGNAIHVQNVSINTDFSREDILELGRKTPYYRPANFPIEVTCEIEAITTSGDFVFAYEEGDPGLDNTTSSGDNTSEDTIFIQLRGGHAWDLGAKNRLTSVSYGGGDATGGNVSTSYSYTNFNDLDVQWSGDYIGFNPPE
jgi:hypothetical protein